MVPKQKNISLFLLAVAPFGIAVIVWAGRGLPVSRVDSSVITLAVLAVFCSSCLRIQLPRLNVHLPISEALIIISLFFFGPEITVVVAVIESAAASLAHLRVGVRLTPITILTKVFIAAIAVFVAARAVPFVFGPTDIVLRRSDLTSFIWLLGVMAVSLFLINSVLVSAYSALERGRSFWRVWTGDVLNSIIVYVGGALLAGIVIKTFDLANIYVFAVIVGFFGIVYLIFKRFVEDVKKTVENAKRAERERAEQTEEHVKQLQHYVAELERSSEALRESHENFRQAAYHDALTGLPNRNYFIDTLKELLQESRDNDESNFAVLFLDLKSFKTINDSLGHSLGDRLIKNVAKRLTSMIREDDMVARFSGDKFGLILTDLLSKEEATSFADRLAKRLSEPYTLDGRQVFTSAKVGIAYGNSKYPEAEEILRDADIAMYYAKDNEENYVIFDQKMHIRAVTRLQLETDLRFAIERNEFELFYQPIVSLSDSSLKGFEALVRWRHPQRGLVPPNEFISISESTGLIIPMTVQILHSACSQVIKWQESYPNGNPLSVSVNLSGKHFGHPALVDQIRTVISETGIDPACLKLELTESAVMESAESAILMLKQIKETGVQISIDDFGTGYSSLSYLHRFPIDMLKVDRSFVSAMEDNTENGEIVRTIIALAKALDLKVVAEGIESIHQFHQLRILGCEYGQGFLFSKPLQTKDIERLLSDKNRWQNILPADPVPLPVQPREIGHLRLA